MICRKLEGSLGSQGFYSTKSFLEAYLKNTTWKCNYILVRLRYKAVWDTAIAYIGTGPSFTHVKVSKKFRWDYTHGGQVRGKTSSYDNNWKQQKIE